MLMAFPWARARAAATSRQELLDRAAHADADKQFANSATARESTSEAFLTGMAQLTKDKTGKLGLITSEGVQPAPWHGKAAVEGNVMDMESSDVSSAISEDGSGASIEARLHRRLDRKESSALLASEGTSNGMFGDKAADCSLDVSSEYHVAPSQDHLAGFQASLRRLRKKEPVEKDVAESMKRAIMYKQK